MDPLRDAPQVLEFKEDGITVSMNKDGEHQFYYLNVNKGPKPKRFEGAFTNYEVAKLAVGHFFEERKREKK